MIREKGTQNVLNHLFNVLNNDATESLTFYEEWAVRVGAYGALDSNPYIEIPLNEKAFVGVVSFFANFKACLRESMVLSCETLVLIKIKIMKHIK